jgi:protein N-terminal methyltransferase
VGRVSTGLLKKHFNELHLVEFAQPLLDEARVAIGDYPSQYFCSSLHVFQPEVAYNVAWAQWVLGHLTDDDLASFLQRLGRSLSPDGFIVIKENVCEENFILDEEDSSITRLDPLPVPHSYHFLTFCDQE